MSDIVEITSGQDIYERERTDGNTPYLTATASNNGIGYFVSNNNDTLESDCLSVNRNGSVGNCFYHPYPALYSNDTRKLRLRRKSKYAALFVSLAITKQKGVYGYGLKMGTGRLKKLQIILPATETEEPHWEWMESLMRELEQDAILSYLKSIQKRLRS